MNATETHCTRIKKHLEDGKRITSLEALNFFDCMNLKGRIFDLRSEPYNLPIQTKMIKLKRSGKYVAQYFLLNQTIKRCRKNKTQESASI